MTFLIIDVKRIRKAYPMIFLMITVLTKTASLKFVILSINLISINLQQQSRPFTG